MSVLYKHNDEVERVAGSYRPIIYNPQPDWANAVPITAAQLNAGYTAPSDGMFVGAAYNQKTGNSYSLTLNGTSIMPFLGQITSNSGIRPVTLSLIVSQGDTLGCTAPVSSIVIDPSLSFVPWKE